MLQDYSVMDWIKEVMYTWMLSPHYLLVTLRLYSSHQHVHLEQHENENLKAENTTHLS
jgi:hypothetical protein